MTVASDAEACPRSFRKCLEHAAAVHPRELSLIEDQLARLSLWIGNIRVFGPGRQSLDHRLREAPEVQDTTAGLLEALTYHVDKCSAILESLKPRDPLQPILALDKSLNKSIRAAADQISLLNKLSNTIRRASKTTQNIQAASSFQILDDEGNDAAGFMQKVFAHYVRDRFQATSEVIQQRLAATMVLRRKRVLYRRERYGDGPIGVEQVSSKPTVVAPHREATAPVSQHPGSGVQKRAESQRQSAIYSLTKSATTLAADHFRKAATPSVVSATKTVPLGSHEELSFPAAPLGAITMKVKQLSQQANSAYALRWKTVRELRNEAIWLEAVAAVGEVTCPFCFYALPAKDVADEMKWIQWLKHMRGHALRWKCKSHPDFMGFTREDFMKHLQTEHNSKLSEAQLGVLSDRSARATGPLFKACPLCDAKKVENGMEDHIVGHLRLLALKSLPGYEDVGGEDAQDLSTQSSEAHSRETIQEAIPDNSSGVDSPFFGWNDADRSDVDENEWRNIEQGLEREELLKLDEKHLI
ncbi:hypothetical protein LA080_010409 [Diaporthe eres]|nr:hypothetical protein LA080_010409 [Diaporthe eres]